MVDGRIKGGRFELQVCGPLSYWAAGTPIGTITSKLPLRRSSTSIMPVVGHWEGQGDILHRPDIYFPFAVECKKWEKWELDGIFSSRDVKWKPWIWWEQAKEQARKIDSYPLLIFTRNRRKVYALLNEEMRQWLKPEPVNGPIVTIERNHGGEKLMLMLLDDLVTTEIVRLREVCSR